MMRATFTALFLALAVAAGAAEPAAVPAPRRVMLKLDDLKTLPGPKGGVHWKYVRVADWLAAKGLKSSFGIICNSLEQGTESGFEWIRKRALENGGLIEFWHHGYDHAMNFDLDGKHCIAEFSGPSYEFQAQHFTQACDLFHQQTGLTFHSFGSAGNAVDASTERVLREHPEIKVWLYGPPKADVPQLKLKRTLNLETAPGHISFETFTDRYKKNPPADGLLLQGHPNLWSDDAWTEFKDVVELLLADGWTFTTPYEYWQSCQR